MNLIILSTSALALCFASLLSAQEKAIPSNTDLDQRLQRIERVLDNRILLDMLQKIEMVQTEVRQLRGEIERLEHELKSMSKRQRDLYLDTDRRLQALESGEGGGINLEDLANMDSAAGMEESDADPASADSAAGGDMPAMAVREEPKSGEKEAYTKAYDILMAGNNNAAITAFDQFLVSFPDGPYSDNAWYWRGEAMYVSRKFPEAVSSFRKVLDDFPGSAKLPDAKLKIAYAHYEQNQFEESRAVLEDLVQNHPASSAARLAKRRLKSMAAEGQ